MAAKRLHGSGAGSPAFLFAMSALVAYAGAQSGSDSMLPGVATYQAPAGFPTSVFSSYWRKPVATAEPQPALYDPVLNLTYPLNLTDPYTIPNTNSDPTIYPASVANLTKTQSSTVIKNAVLQINEIITGSYISGNCSKCIASLAVAKGAAQLVPSLVPDVMVSLCQAYKFHSNATCQQDFSAGTSGTIWTQTLILADVTGLDGQYICNSLSSTFCSAPSVSPLNTTGLFPKPKPANAVAPKPSGKRLKVLHLSDLHLDPRYAVGSEANCTSDLCCRANNFNTALPAGQISFASPLYGYFKCDTPYDLALAALQAIGPLTGTSPQQPLAWTIYTGDLTSHDPESEISRSYVEYAEDAIYYMLKKYLVSPVFPVLGNHDTSPTAFDAPHSFPGPLGQQFSWNYDHVSGLWQNNGWLDRSHADQARLHYGAYSVKNQYGLRIITFNSDFWYHSNYLNLVNTSDPDVSGSFRFLIDELQAAEDAGERVWIMAHVLSGWDGSDPLPNPTNLFYQIIDRYSPHVVANVFFGHTHEDQATIFYTNNATVRDAAHALTTAWIGPSITPLTNLNSGFRLYEVDAETFDVLDAHTFYADVNSFSALDHPTTNNSTSSGTTGGGGRGPTFRYEYSTRHAYGATAGWPADAPLNATFWHRVTEAMERDPGLVSTFNTYQGKSSALTPNCTSPACVAAKVCYMRSASAALGRQCPKGFASVQSPYTGKG